MTRCFLFFILYPFAFILLLIALMVTAEGDVSNEIVLEDRVIYVPLRGSSVFKVPSSRRGSGDVELGTWNLEPEKGER